MNRRKQYRQSTKLFGGTDEAVSPSSYHMTQLTGSKNVFVSNYRQGPMHSFGREDTGRKQIKNKH